MISHVPSPPDERDDDLDGAEPTAAEVDDIRLGAVFDAMRRSEWYRAYVEAYAAMIIGTDP